MVSDSSDRPVTARHCKRSRLVGRIGSEIWVSASFQKSSVLHGSGPHVVGQIASGVRVSASFHTHPMDLLALIGQSFTL